MPNKCPDQSKSIKLTVTPAAFWTDEIDIVASGFQPGERIRIVSSVIDDLATEWTAHGDYVADLTGSIDVSTAPSVGGSFLGVDPAGLFWSLRPNGSDDRSFQIQANAKPHQLGQPACDPIGPVQVRLRAEAESGMVAETSVTLNRLADGIDVVQVNDGRLRGVCYRWRDRSRARGAIMSLTGSGGGIETAYAPLLASLGYDVFSLAYFAYQDLPIAINNIPIEYFEEGFSWMKRELAPTKIAVQGTSRGGELTLVLAAYLPEFVKCAIPIVPMYASGQGWDSTGNSSGPIASWTFRGEEIPYAQYADSMDIEEMQRLSADAPNGLELTPTARRDFDTDETRENAAIPIENADGPILLISGLEDAMWPSAWGSDVVINRLRAKGFKHSYQHLALRETGHWIALPNTVTTFAPAVYHTLMHVFLACGGTPQGAATSSRIMWTAMRDHYRAAFGH